MYRTIESSFWTDPKVKDLPAGTKLLFLYLITNQHSHVSGIYYLDLRYASVDLNITENQLEKGIDTLSASGFVKFDSKNNVVWVINMFRYQGCNEKTTIAASKHLCSLHNSFLCQEFAEKYPNIFNVKNGYRSIAKPISEPDLSIPYPDLAIPYPDLAIPHPGQNSAADTQSKSGVSGTEQSRLGTGTGADACAAPDFELSDIGLAQAFHFYLKGRKPKNVIDEFQEVAAELKRQGMDGQDILAEITNPNRNRTEAHWDFANRMAQKSAQVSIKVFDLEEQKRREQEQLEWLNRGRKVS